MQQHSLWPEKNGRGSLAIFVQIYLQIVVCHTVKKLSAIKIGAHDKSSDN